MPAVDATGLLLAFVVMTLGASSQGVVGFGANLLAAPLLALIDPQLVPGPIIVAAVAMNLLFLARNRSGGDWRTMAPAIGAQAVGATAAGLALASLPTDALGVGFALLVLVAVALSAVGWRVPRSPGTLAVGGAASGFMGTTTGVGGPPIALVLQDLDGIHLRGSLARFFLVGAAVSLSSLALAGRLSAAQVGAGLLLMPGVVAGYTASGWLAARVEPGHLRRAVLALSAASALLALGRALT